VNGKGYGKKRLCTNLRYYLGNCQEGPEENGENLGQDSRYLGRDLNPVLHDYKAGMLSIQLQHTIKNIVSYSVINLLAVQLVDLCV
jgi:hypothetical protein